MDFIERYLGFAPDHGDGSFEAMLLTMLVIVVAGGRIGLFRQACARVDEAQLMEFILIYPSDKSAEYTVKLVHRYLCIVFPFRPPFFLASAAVVLDAAQQHHETNC